MSDPIIYGESKSEKLAEENQVCRQISREISLFGITERQRLMLIYLLAMELEDTNQLQEITSVVKELAGNEIFLSHHTEEGSNGTSNV